MGRSSKKENGGADRNPQVGIIGRRSVQSALLWVAAALWLASMACSNPIQSYYATRDSNRKTATATMWTPTPPNRYFEKHGDVIFSYVPPAGWKIVPGWGYVPASWEGPTQQGVFFVCYLNFMIGESDESEADAAKRTLDSSSIPSEIRIVSQGKFTNDAGLDAYRAVIIGSHQGTNTLVILYFFQNRGYLIMARYGRLVEKNEEQDAIVDASMKTLRYE